jgi:hypothetical protein
VDLHFLDFLSLCFERVCVPCLFRCTFVVSVHPPHLCDCVRTNRRSVQTEFIVRKVKAQARANHGVRGGTVG